MRSRKSFNKISYVVLFLLCLSSCDCGRKNVITIFDQEVRLSSPLEQFAHEEPFTTLIEVENLYYHSVESLSNAELSNCVSALMAKSELPIESDEAFWVFVYTTRDSDFIGKIDIDHTNGFSILRSQGSNIQHDYFEKTDESKFTRIPSLSMSVNDIPELEEIRLLHFAKTGSYKLPNHSTIYEFKARDILNDDWDRHEDRTLRIAILQDRERSWGAPTLGLFGDEIYLALAGETGRFCGGNGKCPEGTSNCGYRDGGTGMVCGGNAVPGVFIQVVNELKDKGFTPDPLDFVMLRSLRKAVLDNSQKGRDYISNYYIASLFLLFDRPLLETYSVTLPRLMEAFSMLVSGPDDHVIVTEELAGLLNRILEAHRNVETDAFHEVLDLFQADLANIQGMTKAQFVAYFQTIE